MQLSKRNKSIPWRVFLICGLATLFLLSGCGQKRQQTSRRSKPPSTVGTKPYKVMGKWYKPILDADGFRQQGLASWYGKKFHGRKTANGERYNMYGLSAAHKTLPLGTWVRVENLDNEKTMDVRINDRGPFVRGRIIDLSYGAAKKIGVLGPGTAPVKIVALGTTKNADLPEEKRTYQPVDYNKGVYTFQVGAFSDKGNAERFKEKLSQTYNNAHVVPHQDGELTFYRVRVGQTSSLTQAMEYQAYLSQNGFPQVITIAE